MTSLCASGACNRCTRPGLGVMRSENGGRSWVARNQGLPGTTVMALTAHADEPDTVYAYSMGKGIFRSQDAGMHWRLMAAEALFAVVADPIVRLPRVL